MNTDMLEQIEHGDGFIAALDQSGGSTPKALALYGVAEDSYSGEDEMFDVMHAMRSRIMTSRAFTGERVIGAILFEQTMDRTVEGLDTPSYLWDVKHVVPFLKVDKGLADEADGVQVMKPIPGLDELLARAVSKGVFGTKMRSVIKLRRTATASTPSSPSSSSRPADPRRRAGADHRARGRHPQPGEGRAEALLKAAILGSLDELAGDERVMLKLSLPTEDGFYSDLIDHPKVIRVVALSGGYPRDEANEILARNPGMIASFSRALTEGLTAQQSDDEFDTDLDTYIGSIFEASKA